VIVDAGSPGFRPDSINGKMSRAEGGDCPSPARDGYAELEESCERTRVFGIVDSQRIRKSEMAGMRIRCS